MKAKKGSSFERKTAARISRWWSKGERDDLFYRSNASGARFTVRKKNDNDTVNSAGDLCAMDEVAFPFLKFFHTELKKGYNGKKRYDAKTIGEKLSNLLADPDPFLLILKLIKNLMSSGGSASIGDFLERKTGISKIWEWYEKSELERIQADRVCSAIIYQKDNKYTCIFICEEIIAVLEKLQVQKFPGDYIMINYNKENYLIIRFGEFLEWLKPETIIYYFKWIKTNDN